MNKLTIAIDLNEVLRDFVSQFIKYYKKGIDDKCTIDYDDVTNFDLWKVFPFTDEEGDEDKNSYFEFRYDDYPYELHGCAELMSSQLATTVNMWINNTLLNFEEDKCPNVLIFSPLETGKSIPSTLFFLSRRGFVVREVYFPTDSSTIWDRADIVISANPNLIKGCPEGKTVLKINAPYNKDAEAKYTYDDIREIIYDGDSPIVKQILGNEQKK